MITKDFIIIICHQMELTAITFSEFLILFFKSTTTTEKLSILILCF